ncbi:MAG: protein phosphatase 2C domain-containing protein [Vicinamibacterales bacterium]
MKWRVAAVCHVGNARPNNEDMVLVGEKVFRDDRVQGAIELPAERPYGVAIADGMGGANAGEIASELVLEQLREGLATVKAGLDDDALATELRTLCLGIHGRVVEEGVADSTKVGMGATLVALVHYQARVFFLAAGDSRLYRYRGGTLKQISKDHSLRAALGSSDVPGNIVLNSFGGGSSFSIDFGPAARRVLVDDVFLLTSDGLSDVVPEADIETILATSDPEEGLLAAALNQGGQDNISYALVEVLSVDEDRGR